MTEFQGEKFFLRVRSIVVIDKKGEQASVPRGALVPLTAFVFDANTQSGIKVFPALLMRNRMGFRIWS